MKKTFIKISALSIALIVAASCSKTGSTGPAGANGATGATGATGPVLTGNMQGVVFLYDVSGAKILSASTQAGDSVIITNTSSGSIMKTVTNSTGAYSFSNLTTGTYSMTVSKPTYGSVIAQGIQFSGGGTANRNFALSMIPIAGVTSAVAGDTSYYSGTGSASGVSENYVKIRGYAPALAGGGTVIVFASIPGASTVSNVPGNFSASYTTTLAPGVSSFKITIPTANLYDLGFASGGTATVSFAAYVIGANTSASSYADWTTGQTVYTALSGSPVIVSAMVQ
ncbi:MAG: carboxypeptidase-like regulatory domain-containing protein [Bacteroidia bacterium]